ncbi:hypothetical protein U1Q18_011297, partial [Sarracenia purpurea var. burkii]
MPSIAGWSSSIHKTLKHLQRRLIAVAFVQQIKQICLFLVPSVVVASRSYLGEGRIEGEDDELNRGRQICAPRDY